MEPLSSRMNGNPYMEVIEYKEFLSKIAEGLESLKGLIGAGAIHDFLNIQGLIFNQIRILEIRHED